LRAQISSSSKSGAFEFVFFAETLGKSINIVQKYKNLMFHEKVLLSCSCLICPFCCHLNWRQVKARMEQLNQATMEAQGQPVAMPFAPK
jgi:hypothetical protein